MTSDQTEKFLSALAESISISNTMIDRAKESYEAVGEWLGDGIDFPVTIMPQGSFNLGTVIKPLSEKDEYDIDLVCLMEPDCALSNYQIKHIVGDRLKENHVYFKKLSEEGKRCWTLEYADFHMDILPCVPASEVFSIENNSTTIKLTHKSEQGEYESHYSDPQQYQKWFEARMTNLLADAKSAMAKAASVEIKEVPTFRVKTPLQKSVQLLKRHRDKMFENQDDAPISIIITTLAAQAYQGERSLKEALTNIVQRFLDGVTKDANTGCYQILNPVLPEENFADKWKTNFKKIDNFFKWYLQLSKDVQIICGENQLFDEDKISRAFGQNPTSYALRAISSNNKNNIHSTRTTQITTPERPYGDKIQ